MRTCCLLEARYCSIGDGCQKRAMLTWWRNAKVLSTLVFIRSLVGSIFVSGDLEEAETLLHKAVSIEPRLSKTHFRLGVVLAYCGSWRKQQIAFNGRW